METRPPKPEVQAHGKYKFVLCKGSCQDPGGGGGVEPNNSETGHSLFFKLELK